MRSSWSRAEERRDGCVWRRCHFSERAEARLPSQVGETWLAKHFELNALVLLTWCNLVGVLQINARLVNQYSHK